MVDARMEGKGQRFFLPTKSEAEGKAATLRTQRDNQGKAGVMMPERLRVDATEAQRILSPFGVTILEAARYFAQHAKPAGGSRTVEQLKSEFLKTKEESKRRPEYLRVQRVVLGKFASEFGAQQLNELSAERIDEWLKAQPWSMRTRLNYFNDLRNLLGFGVKKGYLATNPLARLEAPAVDEADAPGILTPGEAAVLLTAAEEKGGLVTPFFAIGLFAGLRTAELLKLDWSSIDLDEQTIAVAPHVSKTREHRYVSISDNLKLWLLPHRRQKGAIKPAAWRYHAEAARKASGLKEWPKNALRHSFGSYHYAMHHNAAMTAAMLGHRNDTRTLFEHYRALAKPRDAAAFWALAPDSSEKVVSIAA